MIEERKIVTKHQIYSLTEAKSKFSEIINRVLFRGEKFTITKKGKAVVVVAPFDEKPGGEGLIRAKGALAQMDLLIDEMVEDIYQARSEEIDRKVNSNYRQHQAF